jgi:hypothetical protein
MERADGIGGFFKSESPKVLAKCIEAITSA